MDNYQSCAVLGQTPLSFPWGYDEEAEECRDMKLALAQQIMVLRQSGVTSFYVACDPGIGLYAAEIINVLREKDKDLQLFCVAPHEEQATKWTPQLRERYFAMLGGCTRIKMVALHSTPGAQLTAYKEIIEAADIVLAVCNPDRYGGNSEDKAIAYAMLRKCPLVSIHPDTLVVHTRNMSCEK